MSILRNDRHKSPHQLAFEHYLRTGERLTNREWLSRYERKFNPYHDELGRFTSPPGVVVSYGKNDGGQPEELSQVPPQREERPNNTKWEKFAAAGPAKPGADIQTPTIPESATPDAVDLAIQEDWSPEAPIVSRFDLNKRQAYLDFIRTEAGPNTKAH